MSNECIGRSILPLPLAPIRREPACTRASPESLRIAFNPFHLTREAGLIASVGASGEPLGGEVTFDLRALEIDLRHDGPRQLRRSESIRQRKDAPVENRFLKG